MVCPKIEQIRYDRKLAQRNLYKGGEMAELEQKYRGLKIRSK